MKPRIKIILLSAFTLFFISCMNKEKHKSVQIDHNPDFPSSFVEKRNIEVMLPPGYPEKNKSYDVLYIHDGQNVFNPETSYGGVAWELDSVMVSLLKEQEIRPVIVVAIWNTPMRMQEYMPAKPQELVNKKAVRKGWEGEILSDNYLRFIVDELKPFIDSAYNTNSGQAHTFIMGSSMGGLISLYALCEYPETFAGAACLSTHWPALDGVFLQYVKKNLPDPGNHLIYFDFGTKTLDAGYENYQVKVDSIMKAKGYQSNEEWITRKFEGADHSEKAWKERVHIPLLFLFGREK